MRKDRASAINQYVHLDNDKEKIIETYEDNKKEIACRSI